MNFDLYLYGLRATRVELPAVSLQNWSFRLGTDVSGFAQDLTVPLVVMHDQWCFATSDAYQLWRGKEPHFERQLAERDVLRLEVPGQGTVAVQVVPQLERLPTWERYLLRKTRPQVTIGAALNCEISVRGTRVLADHQARLFRDANGDWRLRTLSQNGLCYVNGAILRGERVLRYADVIDLLGVRLVYLGEVLCVEPPAFAEATMHVSLDIADEQSVRWIADVNLRASSREAVDLFSPSPRLAPDFDVEPIDIEGPPNQQGFQDQSLLSVIGPALTSVVPMAAAAALTTVASPVGLPMMMASAASSAFWSHRNQKQRKREAEDYERLRVTRYRDYLRAKRQAVATAHADNRRTLLKRYPPAETVVGYDTTSGGLWTRNRYQADYGFVRLGLATYPSPKPVNVPAQRFTLVDDDLVDGPSLIKEEFAFLEDVPVGIDLLEQSLFGIIGEAGEHGYAAVVRALIAQLATSYRYDDLKIAFVCDGTRDDDRAIAEAVRWLPHVWTENHTFRFIANDENSTRTVLREIASVAAERSTRRDDKVSPAPHYAVFVMPGTPLGSTMASTYLLDSEAALGMTTFVCAERFAQLPNACTQIIEHSAQFSGARSVRDARGNWLDISFDEVPTRSIAKLARRLCAVRLETPETDQGIPTTLTFTELYGVETVEDLNIGERWRTHAANESLAVPIGKGPADIDFLFDVHEKFHGPHGLVAGTTGSGKSETLMAWVLSLAVNFAPDEVTFLLVDFKGGGLANHFEHDGVPLPHVVGTITNLSGNAIQRALAAVRSENERRQRMLAEVGANDVYEYGRLYHNREVSEPMPHLMIVVDEFAELKTQFPEFIDELVSVATIGRALGVHLVLATQKPAGVVSGAIEANATFRLCLRVQTKEDSKSMIDVSDAARDKLAMPAGRTIAKIGASSYLEEFQSAFTRAPYTPGVATLATDVVRMRTLTGTIGRQERHVRQDGGAPTQLMATVAHIIEHAQAQGVRPARQLWMPELPSAFPLSALPAPDRAETWSLEARIGRYDQPERQYQGTAVANLSLWGNLLVVGPGSSGKSTLLQTLVYELATAYTPNDLWVYALDFSNRMLDSLAGLPHVGGILHEGDDDGIARLFYLIGEMMRERRALLRGGTYLQYRQHEGADLPAVVVVIDNYASFREKTGDAYGARVVQLAKQGPGLGIHLAISAAGIGSQEVPMSLAGSLRERLALQLSDRYAYRDLLGASSLNAVPELGRPGRGMLAVGDTALEFQVALATGETDDFARAEHLSELATQMAQAWDGKGAQGIPRIPDDPTLTAYLALEEVTDLLADGRHLPIGYDLRSAQPTSLDLSTIFCYVVSGKEQMGRQNFMAMLMRLAARMTAPGNIHVLGRGRGACLRAANDAGAVYHQPNGDWGALYEQLKDEILRRNARKHALELQGLSDNALYAATCDDDPIFLFIEDLTETIKRLASDKGLTQVRDFLNVVTDRGWYHRIYVFAGLDQNETPPVRSDTLYRNVVRDGAGMHFGGNTAGQQLLSFDYLGNFRTKSQKEPPSIGLPASGDYCRGTGKVVVPDASR